MLDSTRLFTLMETYTSQVGDSIRYIIEIHFHKDDPIPLKIRYVDSGGNFHSIGFNQRGMVTFP
jgi:hypothetical protein